MLTYAEVLAAARSEALARLLQIVRESASETQARLAAAAILRIPDPKDSFEQLAKSLGLPAPSVAPSQVAPPPPPAPKPACQPHPAQTPLSEDELAELQRFLPTVSPSRFITKHTPNCWRDVLNTHRRGATVAHPLQTRDPPSNKRAA